MRAHCETGTITNILNHYGLEITEPMVFGIASGIFFGYFKSPYFTFPVFIVRSKPGQIRKGIAKQLGVKFEARQFKNPIQAEEELDSLLEKNIPTAVQVDFFFMDYMPSWTRTHINVHFITIIGKNGSKYIVSDSYHPKVAEIERETLRKARFTKGNMAPKGFLYYPTLIPEKIDYEKAVIKGIKKTVYYMLKLPVPFLGIKGIYRFADKVTEWPKYARDTEHLSHEIMKITVFLEEQGTGGAGFRYMYATFLRQAGELINNRKLIEMSEKMMKIGDGWREISLFAARTGKNRDLGTNRLKELSNMIKERGDVEKEFFKNLSKIVK